MCMVMRERVQSKDKPMITEDKASEEHKKRRVKARESSGESQSKSKSKVPGASYTIR